MERKVEAELSNASKITKKATRTLFEQVIAKYHERLLGAQPSPQFPASYAEEFVVKRRAVIDKLITSVFENLPITKKAKTKLYEIAARIFHCDSFWGAASGIVIAGYGVDEIFPSLIDYDCDFRVDGFVRHKERRRMSITTETTSAVVPFAQTEMVSTFMEGIDPNLQNAILRGLESLFTAYSDVVNTHIGAYGVDPKLIDQHTSILLEEFTKNIREYRRREHVMPIIDMVALLPKDELALMAEALVNLTSLKRRVTPDAETVGGAVDVAVITKGDGLVWIKRKHYFDQSLNQHFFDARRAST